MSPFMFGVIDGLYPGITALVRWFGGIAGDRMKQAQGTGGGRLRRFGRQSDRVAGGRREHDMGSPRPSPPTAWGKAYARRRAMR